MSDVVDRLRDEVETIARSNSPSLTFTAVSREGLPHSATVWFAPTDSLDLLTFSAPTRTHSKIIEDCEKAGRLALVAGGMRTDGQQKSQPNQHGVTFEGTANRLWHPIDVQAALSRFSMYETFQREEIDKYLNHPTEEIPSHGVYVLKPVLWTVFDNRLGPTNPDRLVHVPWPPEEE